MTTSIAPGLLINKSKTCKEIWHAFMIDNLCYDCMQ
jgi:hypothetical protein